MARKSNKSTKQQTVKEFQSWLDGLLEFQEDNWIPTAAQWKTIKERIYNLKDEVVQQPVAPQSVHQTVQTSGYLQTRQPVVESNPSSALDVTPFDPNSIQLLPTGDGPAERISVPTLLPSGLSAPTVEVVSTTVRNSGTKIKTPSDISGNPYKSPFA